MIVDARYESCRVDGKIIGIAVLIALGIDSDGYRQVLGVETAWGETGDSWDRFIGGLKERGLKGVRLFTSDAYPGIHPAIKNIILVQYGTAASAIILLMRWTWFQRVNGMIYTRC